MQIFLDTADLNEINYFLDIGIIDGVTTNPSLIAGKNYSKIAKEICSLMDGKPVSLEVISTDYKSMVEEALQLKSWAKNVVIKLPLTADGLKACKHLSSKNIEVNVTLCFSAAQAILAAKAGATYVSVFVGRLDDIGHDSMEVVADVMWNYYHAQSDEAVAPKVIVASVRNPWHVVQSGKMGVNICTVPPKVLRQMIEHPLTDKGLEKFLADWKKAEKVC